MAAVARASPSAEWAAAGHSPSDRVGQGLQSVAVIVEVDAGVDERAETGYSLQGYAEAPVFGDEEFLFVVQVVADDDGAAQVGEHVAGDLLERGGIAGVGVGDPVVFGVGDRHPRVDHRGVFVEDEPVAAHPHDPHLAEPGALPGVKAGGFEVEDSERQRARVDAGMAAEVATGEHSSVLRGLRVRTGILARWSSAPRFLVFLSCRPAATSAA